MSKKQIMLVYQDCPTCGAREGWGEAQTKVADAHGMEIVKVPFYKEGIGELIWKACKSGMTLPFFTDGENFSKDIIDFKEPDYIEDAEAELAKPKTKKGKKNGTKRKAS